MWKITRADLFSAIVKKFKALHDVPEPFTLKADIQPVIDMGAPSNVPYADYAYGMFSGASTGNLVLGKPNKRFVITHIDIAARLIGTDTATYVQVNAYLKGTQCQIVSLLPVPSVAGSYAKATPCEIVVDANQTVTVSITGTITNVTCFCSGYFIDDVST